jgi:copper chaperone CopZ
MNGTWKKSLPIALAVLLVAGAAIAGGAAIKARHATAGKAASAGHCDGQGAAVAAGTACEGHDAATASGSTCTDHDAAMAEGRCPVSGATAKMAAGGDCPYMGPDCDPAKGCGVRANQAIYSFAVPGASCDACVHDIQHEAMAMKGVACVHVDLNTHTAYIIADKSVSKSSLTAAIQKAGFKSSFQGEGSKVEAEFAKAMSGAGAEGATSGSAPKEKGKV